MEPSKNNLENNTNKNFEIKTDLYDQLYKDNQFFNKKNVNLKIYTEPVDAWRDLNGNNLLEYMYKDPSRYSFAFHSYVQLTMLENHKKISQYSGGLDQNQSSQFDSENFLPRAKHFPNEKYNINVMERSLYSAKYCFLENIYRS